MAVSITAEAAAVHLGTLDNPNAAKVTALDKQPRPTTHSFSRSSSNQPILTGQSPNLKSLVGRL
jgi:hypothetical protein